MGLALILGSVYQGAAGEVSAPTVRLGPSDFRLIRKLEFPGRTNNLFDLAIAAGMYERRATEYLPGNPWGPVSAGGRAWYGSDGVGLVALDPQSDTYAIYYLQERAVPGHHLRIVYACDEQIFFCYGALERLPSVQPTLAVYSVKHDRFARIESVTPRGGTFGRFDYEILKQRRPGNIGPAKDWNDTRYAHMEWIPASGNFDMFHPNSVSLRNGVFTLRYHTSWEIHEFVTEIHFLRDDLHSELQKLLTREPKP